MCKQICNMLLLVVYCTLNLLVLTRGTRVFDEHNQDAEANKYCTEEGAPECKAGTHVLCMYDEAKMGPRCLNGEIVPFAQPEIEFLKNIFNGFKRNIAKHVEITGKDDEYLPRGKHMRAYHWGFHLAREAQAWANQCNPLEHDLCRNYVEEETDRGEYHEKITIKAGQFVTVFRFSYPDWSYPGQDFEDYSIENKEDPTPEKIRFMIKEITKGIYESRKLVTAHNIHKYTREQRMNPYLLVVYGPNRRFGCAMTKYVDHVVGEKSDDLYNAVMFVCNFSGQPLHNQEVYYYVRPVDAKIKGITDPPWEMDKCGCRIEIERNDDCLCNDNEDSTELPPATEKQDEQCSDEMYVEKDGPPAVVLMPIFTAEKADLNKQLHKRVALNEHEQRKYGLAHNIKNDFDTPRNDFAINLGLSNGPFDAFIQPQFKPATMNPFPIRKASDLKSPKKRKRHTIKPRKDFSNMDQLVSEYLAQKRKNLQMATNVHSHNDMSNIATATVTPIELSNTNNRYRLRAEHNSKVIEYKNMNKMFQNNILKTEVGIPGTYNNLLRAMKKIRNSDLIRDIVPSYIDYDQQNIEAKRNKFSTRNQNPLHVHAYDRNNFDYNKPFENGNVEYNNPPEMLINPDYDERETQNGDAYTDVISSGDNVRSNRHDVYGKKKIRNIYINRPNYRRVFKPHDKEIIRLGHQRRGERIEALQDQHYIVPDRLNSMREL